ncbi:hypothetical protein NC653_037214 [Populus alba x Populus x berolinensis]|uniref:Uncharacterized protein n=1 Tax=Populus alba x Populus x berolinensis TaxID=444605 RepID=A0AAD6LDV3_9ROSI|nr:hypothetical protein NC653_037214 [Populus alba x Populus x berolinensis]
MKRVQHDVTSTYNGLQEACLRLQGRKSVIILIEKRRGEVNLGKHKAFLFQNRQLAMSAKPHLSGNKKLAPLKKGGECETQTVYDCALSVCLAWKSSRYSSHHLFHLHLGLLGTTLLGANFKAADQLSSNRQTDKLSIHLKKRA